LTPDPKFQKPETMLYTKSPLQIPEVTVGSPEVTVGRFNAIPDPEQLKRIKSKEKN